VDKDTRNAIDSATQRARKLLEADFTAQLDGDFDVHRNGVVAAKPGSYLSAQQVFQREKIVAAIEHKRAAGMSAAESVADYLRDAAFTTLNRFVALKINFAPLWRLVPQHKAWQKALKATWDALCDGTYDWAHLAMHLWPERVVPKCATDRSFAIAHGLEDIFWVEGDDGKWSTRKSPTRPIEELVAERTSPAVKSALKSLIEAPVAAGGSKKTRKGKSHA
jgi:hypothetical protein